MSYDPSFHPASDFRQVDCSGKPRAKYEIKVLFKSNEAPWSGGYDPSPYGPKNDGEAVEWAVRMQEGLGDLYAVTLMRDGQVMPLPEPPSPAGEG